MLRALTPVIALGLTACQNMPPPYSLPPQRTSFGEFRPYQVSRIVKMTDADAMSHVIADVMNPSGGWSWTGKRPSVKVKPKNSDGLTYVMDFAVADATFGTTGPVTISFFLNDHKLDTIRYDKPGEQHFAKAVPAEWVRANEDNVAAAEIDKMWVSPTDGVKLGFILMRVGLTER